MKEVTTKLQEQKGEEDISVQAPEKTILDTNQKSLVQTFNDEEEENVVTNDDSIDNDGNVEKRVRKLTKSLVSGEKSEELENSEGLTPEKIAEKLQGALRYAYHVFLREKVGGEHIASIEIGDYVFAALGFTCGYVDRVQVFKKIDKKVFFIFKKKEYVPVEVTMEIVNVLAKAGGYLPPLDNETLQRLL